MKTLSSKQYERAYAYAKYRDAEDYADLLSALVDDIEQFEEAYYQDYKLDKRSKVINGADQRNFHMTARPLASGLQSSIRQFYSHLLTPDQVFMNDKFFNQKNNDDDRSPANQLRIEIDNLKKFIVLFRKRHEIELRRSYRYDDGRLYYSPSKYVHFKSEGFPKALMEILFKDFTRVFDNEYLTNELISVENLYLRNVIEASDAKSYVNKIKKACAEINKRIMRETKTDIKLIDHNTKTTSLNKFAFDQIDRIQFDKNR